MSRKKQKRQKVRSEITLHMILECRSHQIPDKKKKASKEACKKGRIVWE